VYLKFAIKKKEKKDDSVALNAQATQLYSRYFSCDQAIKKITQV
jgi:hypothetical protein